MLVKDHKLELAGGYCPPQQQKRPWNEVEKAFDRSSPEFQCACSVAFVDFYTSMGSDATSIKNCTDEPICRAAVETQAYRTDLQTQWKKWVGGIERLALKHVNYHM